MSRGEAFDTAGWDVMASARHISDDGGEVVVLEKRSAELVLAVVERAYPLSEDATCVQVFPWSGGATQRGRTYAEALAAMAYAAVDR